MAVPRLIVQEVTRNLDTTAQVHKFYRLLYHSPYVVVVDEPVPRGLVAKYVQLGLPEKADAVIGAFVEWVGAAYLISDNRHFLQKLKPAAFRVLSPAERVFVKLCKSCAIGPFLAYCGHEQKTVPQ